MAMKKLFKTLLKVVAILIVLFLVVSILVATLVDINQYKNEIAQWVENETGLKLEINGDMALSVFSGVKFNAKDIKLFQNKALIADIDSLHLGVDIHSLYIGEPEITSLELHANILNISRDKKGNYNFLPLLTNSQDNTVEADDLSLNQLSVKDIQLSIDRFHYLDDLESLSIKLDKVKASLSLLPIIDHHKLVIDDPRILVAYSYSGELAVRQALINQYQIADLSLQFKDHMGDFIAEHMAFSFIQEGVDHALPPLVFDANGTLMFKVAYHIPDGAAEPLWTQPDVIKVAKFDFNLLSLKLNNKQYQLETDNAHLAFEKVAIFEAGQYVLNDLLIKSLAFESKQVDLNWKNEGKYFFKKFLLQVNDLPVIHKGKPLELMSDVFLKKFAQKGSVSFSCDSVSNKAQGLENVKIFLKGKNKRISLSTLSFKAMESELTGEGYIKLEKKSPQWELKIRSDKLNLQPVAGLMNAPAKIEGYASIDTHLSGVLQNSDFKVSTGRIQTRANNVLIDGIDFDKVLEDFQSSQSVGLLDVGAVTLLGPAGMLVTKGNDYRTLSNSLASKGRSKIIQLNSDIAYSDDIATMNDVAFATEKHRLAVNGKINVQNNTFIKFEVATVDAHGCPIYKEEVKGSLDSPSVRKVNVLVSGVVNPVSSVISKVTKRLKMRCKKPFYTGVVKPAVN